MNIKSLYAQKDIVLYLYIIKVYLCHFACNIKWEFEMKTWNCIRRFKEKCNPKPR